MRFFIALNGICVEKIDRNLKLFANFSQFFDFCSIRHACEHTSFPITA